MIINHKKIINIQDIPKEAIIFFANDNVIGMYNGNRWFCYYYFAKICTMYRCLCGIHSYFKQYKNLSKEELMLLQNFLRRVFYE